MSETTSIPPANLLVDAQNPRLPQPNTAQREILKSIAERDPRKFLVLAKDIAKNGLSPSELPIVMPAGDQTNRYIVLEGNRRISAVKIIENPDLVADILDKKTLQSLRELSRDYQQSPIEFINCVVVKDREAAKTWILLRHTGQNNGAGVLPWGHEESERFKVTTGDTPYQVQALDFLEKHGLLTHEDRCDVPLTSLKRLLGTPEVRKKLGVGLVKGVLMIHADPKQVAKALAHVVNDLTSKNVAVRDIYTKPDRLKYAEQFPASLVPSQVSKAGVSARDVALDQNGTAKKKPNRARKAQPTRVRDYLIPSSCFLKIADPRIMDISGELRSISIERFPNAVAVLLRVFLELSLDAYIDGASGRVAATHDDKLAKKIATVVADLLAFKKLTQQQAKPVKRIGSQDSFLAPSIEQMHQYIHNRHTFPANSDMRTHWDSLQPFVVALWPA